MNRSIAAMGVQLVLLGLAAYLAFAPDALPGASTVARAAIVVLVVVVSYLVAWVSRLHAHLGLLIQALRQGAGPATPKDVRQAVDILIDQLSTENDALRETVHRNLVRITGQDLPPDVVVWRSWWANAREGFQPRQG